MLFKKMDFSCRKRVQLEMYTELFLERYREGHPKDKSVKPWETAGFLGYCEHGGSLVFASNASPFSYSPFIYLAV